MSKFDKLFPKRIYPVIDKQPVSIDISPKDFSIAKGCVSLLDTDITEETLSSGPRRTIPRESRRTLRSRLLTT